MTLAAVVGELVKNLRGKRSQNELKKISGVTQSTISAIEVGNRKFDSDHLSKIFKATGISELAAIKMMNVIADRMAHEEQVSRISPRKMAEDLKRLSEQEPKASSQQPTDKRARAKKKQP